MAEKTINLRGLKCPLPALRARKALTGLKAGDVLIAECTDPLTAIDIPNLLNQTGDELESSAREGDVLVFRIREKGSSARSRACSTQRMVLGRRLWRATSPPGPPARSPASSARLRPR